MNFRSLGSRMCQAAFLFAALMAASCSDTAGGLLDTVPASSSMVARVDVGTVVKRAGCRTDGGGIVFTPQVAALLGSESEVPAPPVRVLTALGGCVDLDDVVAYRYDTTPRGTAVTFRITDREAFGKSVAGLDAVATAAGGVDYYEMDDWTLAAMGDQGWMAPVKAQGMVGIVGSATDLSRDESVAAIDGIADFLGGDYAVKVAVKESDNAADVNRQCWTCLSVKIEEPVIGVHVQMIRGDGDVRDLAAGLKPVDTDFLRYVPDNCVLAAAIGCTPEFDWAPVRSTVGMLFGPEAALNMQMVEPFLSKIDGTVAFAAGPAGGAPAIADINYRTWDFMIMAHMPQAEVDQALNMVMLYGSQLGIRTEAVEDNITEMQLPDGARFYVGNVDGYMLLSTRRPGSASASGMTDLFLSKPGAVVLNVPAGSEIVKAFGLPCGFDCSVQLADDYVHGRLSLNGSDRSVLQVLLEELVKD